MNRRLFGKSLWASLLSGALGDKALSDERVSQKELLARIEAANQFILTRSIEEIAADSIHTGAVLSDVIQRVASCISIGDTSQDINDRLTAELASQNFLPTMLGYNGFPAESAVSIGPELLHAPPSPNKIVKDGDLVTIQLGGSSSQSHAAQGWTVPVGTVSPDKQRVVDACREALAMAISVVSANVSTTTIANAIQAVLDEFDVHPIKDFCGYTMGQERIQPPNILAYGLRGSGEELPKNTILNIHVFATTGSGVTRVSEDMWTASPRDGKAAAMATMMVLVRDNDGLALSRPIEVEPKICGLT